MPILMGVETFCNEATYLKKIDIVLASHPSTESQRQTASRVIYKTNCSMLCTEHMPP